MRLSAPRGFPTPEQPPITEEQAQKEDKLMNTIHRYLSGITTAVWAASLIVGAVLQMVRPCARPPAAL